MQGWLKIRPSASYCNMSERTLRGWLKEGLKHSRIKGTVLIKVSDLDQYLKGFAVDGNQVDQLVDGMVRGL